MGVRITKSTKPVQTQLEHARFLRRWWWLDPAQVAEKCEAALAWETIRRTRSYRALWRKYVNGTLPLLQHQGKPKLAGAFQHMHLLQRSRQALGQPYFDLIMKSFDPDLTWLELEESQRLTARGYIIGDGVTLNVNEDYVLPRQVAGKPCVSVGIVQLERNGSGKLRLIRDGLGGGAIGKVEDTDFFRDLPLDAPGQFVFIVFDTRAGRDALLESFDVEMQRWLGTPLPASGQKADARYWANVVKNTKLLAVRWNPKDKTPVEYWEPKNRNEDVRVKASEHALIPSEDPAMAILMISARHNPAKVRAVLHTQLKSSKFRNWHPKCVAFWKTLTTEMKLVPRNPDGSKRIEIDKRGFPIRETVVRHRFDPKKHLPSLDKPKRSARRKNLWLGLAANDTVTGGLQLGKSTSEGVFLRDQSSSYHALHNARRSAQNWLKELDKRAGRLDKNIGHWNDQSAALASIGFFKAAAGKPPHDPK